MLPIMASFQSLNSSINSGDDINVIIVGAGISGLTAAYELMQHDKCLHLIVIEAKERVGGKTLSVDLHARNSHECYDLGAQWVSSSQHHIMHLLRKLGISTYRQYTAGYKAGRIGYPSWEKFSEYPVFGSIFTRYEVNRFIYKLERLAQDISMNNPMVHPEAHELDKITLDSYVSQNLTTTSARNIFRTLIRMQYGAEASEISTLYFLAHCNGTCGFGNQFSAESAGAREFRIKGGAQQISQRLMQKIGQQNIVLGDSVAEILQDDCCVMVVTAQRCRYRAEHVIVSIPPTEILKIKFQPSLSTIRKKVLERYHPGHVLQFVLTYKEPFWRKQGYSGDMLDYNGIQEETGNSLGPFTMVCDASSENGGYALMGQLLGVPGIIWSDKKKEVRKREILNCLANVWGNCVYAPLDFVEHDWSKDEFIGGGPTYSLNPGNMSLFNYLQSPYYRIHWAGSETSPIWTGYMSGAVLSGYRAAIEVLYEIRPQVLTARDIESIGKGFERDKPYIRRTSSNWFGIIVPILLLTFLLLYKKYFKNINA